MKGRSVAITYIVCSGSEVIKLADSHVLKTPNNVTSNGNS